MSDGELAHPPALTLELGARTLVLTRGEDERYAATVDGVPRKLRTRQADREVSEGGGGRTWGATAFIDSDTAGIDVLLRCLANDPTYHSIGGGIQLSATDNWGHFRQRTSLTITVVLTADDAVEIDADVATQDESYY